MRYGDNGLKADVQHFWRAAPCGERLYLRGTGKADYRQQLEERYRLEPYIYKFADFENAAGKNVLEVGVGLGADHQSFAEAGAVLSGVDFTDTAITHTRRRLSCIGAHSNLQRADAEALPFADDSFDLVYAWGVIHHSPCTEQAADEIMRVLRPGGRFAVMIYHRHSWVGLMLWLRYGLLTGKPFTSLHRVFAERMESPGTKAFTPPEAVALFNRGARVSARIVLTHGDLLESLAGQRHRGLALTAGRLLWPRWLIRRIGRRFGLFLLVEGAKATAH